MAAQPPIKVLIIEDQPADAELMARELTRSGMDCRFSRVDVETALRDALAAFEPDVVLSDFSLPQFDGRSALDIVIQERPWTPFIFVSGTIGEVRAIDAMKRGATDYVFKTDLARLAPAVQRALRESSVRQARRKAEEMLRDNERRLRDIVETSQDWIWALDASGRFTFCNGAVEQILGYSPEELQGLDFRTLLHEEDREGADGRLPAASPGRAVVAGAIARWRHKSDGWRWLERNAVALLDAQGELIGYRGTDRDITERREQQVKIARLSRIHAMLSRINSAIVRMRSRDDMLREACRIAVEQGGYGRASVDMIQPGMDTLYSVARAGRDSPALAGLKAWTPDEASEESSMTIAAIRSGDAAICNDLASDAQPVFFRRELLALRLRSAVVLPLLVDGTAVGTLTFCAREPDVFDALEMSVLRELAANISFALQYFQKEDAVHFLSYFEPLTGLAKRALFCERVAQRLAEAHANGRCVAVLAFDLERLSAINDSFGRHIGDSVLQRLADRMRQRFPDTDRLAQLGGGTFAVAFADLDCSASASPLLREQAHDLIRESFYVEGQEIRLTARFGFAFFPDDGETAETLVRNAEAAVTQAKSADETSANFALQLNAEMVEKLALERKLARALERDQFILHYQPKVHIETGRIDGVEALLRWRDPEQGLVPPGLFISTLEEMRLIVNVGKWVIQQAFRDSRIWREHGFTRIEVAVNVSPLQLRHREFAESILNMIGEWGTERCGLDLEITESMLMEDVEGSVKTLQRLRDCGVKIAIDDFGTGYSSLGHLARLPVDSVKIDRSFVQGLAKDEGSRAIVSTIISLAKAFKMATIAEGVETREQLDLLRTMKCDYVQGFLFARPMPAGDLLLMLQQHRDRAQEVSA